jgi:hypothetical protein
MERRDSLIVCPNSFIVKKLFLSKGGSMPLKENKISGIEGDNNLYKKILQKGTLESPGKSTSTELEIKEEMDLLEKK